MTADRRGIKLQALPTCREADYLGAQGWISRRSAPRDRSTGVQINFLLLYNPRQL